MEAAEGGVEEDAARGRRLRFFLASDEILLRHGTEGAVGTERQGPPIVLRAS